jgi:hypothetical protein
VVPYLSGGIDYSDPFMPALANSSHMSVQVRTQLAQGPLAPDTPLSPMTPSSTQTSKSVRTLGLDRLDLYAINRSLVPFLSLNRMMLYRSFDEDYPSVVIDVRLGPEVTKETTNNTTTRQGPIKTVKTRISLYETIKPWFLPSTYPFIPPPLSYLLVITIPLVFPAVFLILSTFTCQLIASKLRIRRHFRSKLGSQAHGARATNLADRDTEAYGSAYMSPHRSDTTDT